MNCYIGIDAGTTNIKTTAFDGAGKRIALVSDPTPTEKVSYAKERFYEFNAEKITGVVIDQLRRVCKLAEGYEIRGISVSSMGESGIPVDKEFRPLSFAIAWYDTRSEKQASELSLIVGDERIYEITGHFSSYKFGITKIMWFKQHHPDLFRRTSYWMTVNEYILYSLTGKRVCDYSIASRNLCFDIRKKTWSGEILNAAGISPDLFCDPVPGGTAVGCVSKEIVERTGIPAAAVVSAGGHDHACAAIGTNILRPGHALCSMGTSEVTMMALAAPYTSKEAYMDQCAFYPHCSSELYRSLSSMQACGVSLDWAAGFLGYKGPSRYEKLLKAAEKAGENLPLYYPFLRGTMFVPGSGGILLGLHEYHTRYDLAEAVFMGLCCETKFLSERIAQASKQPILCIHAAGGPSKSEHFMQLKADMMECDVELSSESEAACLGAAILAAVGSGDLGFGNIGQMAARVQKVYHPRQNRTADRYYALYKENRGKVLELTV